MKTNSVPMLTAIDLTTNTPKPTSNTNNCSKFLDDNNDNAFAQVEFSELKDEIKRHQLMKHQLHSWTAFYVWLQEEGKEQLLCGQGGGKVYTNPLTEEYRTNCGCNLFPDLVSHPSYSVPSGASGTLSATINMHCTPRRNFPWGTS